MSKRIIHEVALTEAAEIIEQTTISASHDLGTSVIHVGVHAVLGEVTIVSNLAGRVAVVRQTM